MTNKRYNKHSLFALSPTYTGYMWKFNKLRHTNLLPLLWMLFSHNKPQAIMGAQ